MAPFSKFFVFLCISSLISVVHGSWTPSQQYLEEAVDFSFADFETVNEIEEQELETVINAEDMNSEDMAHRKIIEKKVAKMEKEHQKHPDEMPSMVLRRRSRRRNRRRSLLQNLGQSPPDIPTPFGPGANGFNLPFFDPRKALPNPANIIQPLDIGDEGQGDEEMQKLRAVEEAQNAPKSKGKGGGKGGGNPFLPGL